MQPMCCSSYGPRHVCGGLVAVAAAHRQPIQPGQFAAFRRRRAFCTSGMGHGFSQSAAAPTQLNLVGSRSRGRSRSVAGEEAWRPATSRAAISRATHDPLDPVRYRKGPPSSMPASNIGNAAPVRERLFVVHASGAAVLQQHRQALASSNGWVCTSRSVLAPIRSRRLQSHQQWRESRRDDGPHGASRARQTSGGTTPSSVYKKNKHWTEALAVLTEMRHAGRPSIVSFNWLSTCAKAASSRLHSSCSIRQKAGGYRLRTRR